MYEMKDYASEFNQTMESFNSDAVDESALDDELAALESSSMMQPGETSYLDSVATVVEDKSPSTTVSAPSTSENVSSASVTEQNRLY